jgi:UDP-glucose 4-epimerase
MVYGARPDNPSFLGEDTALRGRPRYALVEDKVDAERQLERFRREAGVPVTVLRTAPLLGPGVRTLAGRYLSLPAVPTVMGFNPLVQLLHPDDAVEAFRLAILRAAATDQSAVYNVAGKSVLPLLTAIRLAARRSLPLPGFAAAPMVDALFQAGAAIAPAAHLDYLRWACVADRTRAADELGFVPRYSAKEAVSAFARGRWRAAA